jgi:hypothetical protein
MGGVSGPYPLGLGRPAHPGGTLENFRVPRDTRSAAESRATPKRIALIPRSASPWGASPEPRSTLATMLRVTTVMIDWSTAMVKPRGRYLELAVRLSTAPDSVWKNEFARISHMTDGLGTEPWWANVPEFDELTVGGIEVGTEATVRTRLDGMIRETNTAAARARKEQDEIAYARMQAVKAQEESAKRMTERFRSPG